MSKRIKVNGLAVFDAAPYLDSNEAITSYLTDILQANDAGLLSAMLGDIARARGMPDIAKAAGITREALYKALRPGSAPRFDIGALSLIGLDVRLANDLAPGGDLLLDVCAETLRGSANHLDARRCKSFLDVGTADDSIDLGVQFGNHL